MAKTVNDSASFKITEKIKRPSSELIEKLRKYPASLVSDCLQRFCTMGHSIKPIIEGRRIVGPAVTVEEIEGGNLMSHFAMYLCRKGDVLVIDGKGITSRATWGALQSYVCSLRGVEGVVIDGAIRDIKEIKDIGIQVFCKAVTPAGPHKGYAGNINQTISCGGMAVNPGDIIVGDDDGITVVKKGLLESLVRRCEARFNEEKKWFDGVKSGKKTVDILNFTKKIKEYPVSRA